MAISPGKVLTKIFGSRNDRLLKRLWREVDQITALEDHIQAQSDEQLKNRCAELRKLLTDGGKTPTDTDDGRIIMHEAFAIMRESMDRHIGIRQIFNPEQNFDPNQLDDAMLQAYDNVQQQMIQGGVSWQQVAIPHELYGAVRKIYSESRPPFRARPFDVQLIGGLVLYEGKIAEMKTGEGKTFVAPLACIVKALQGKHSHVVTVNDYLVRRDALWVKPAFDNLGLSVGFIQSGMDPSRGRAQSYACDITYGTSSEFGFDYLRDNMKERVDLQVQGPLDFAIVDEIDSILIDEARTPLIISGMAAREVPDYGKADAIARHILELHKPYEAAEQKVDAAKRRLKSAQGDEKTEKKKAKNNPAIIEAENALIEAEEELAKYTKYYDKELDRKSVHLTHEGIAAAQEKAGVGSFYVGENTEWPHLMEQAMRAHVCYECDKDYMIAPDPRSGKPSVIIVDESTGRPMYGRQWSDGLHQAAEAKEGVPIKEETQTMATVTLQNFFKLYEGLSGMTGTAQTEAEEFSKIYTLEVVSIPTNRPVVRDDADDLIFRTEPEKWQAIVDDIKEVSDSGRPVLVGTTSVEKSEFLSRALKKKHNIDHEVLNAKQHEREAPIIEQAGRTHKDKKGKVVGNVTIATNMAGRGTDIKPEKVAMEAGGLHVIGTERHTARRIDDQLRGRSGRQGDPGSSRFYVSLQDDLMKQFAGEWTIKVLGFLGMKEGEAIEDKRITKGIMRAQKKVEERNFLARKNLLDYDEVNNVQRTYFYNARQRVLEGREIDKVIWETIGQSIEDAVDRYVVNDYAAANIAEWVREAFDINAEAEDFGGKVKKFTDIEDRIRNRAKTEVEGAIPSTLGEFMGEDPDDPTGWDVQSITQWASKQFGVTLEPGRVREMDAAELDGTLMNAAFRKIDAIDVSPIQEFLEPKFALGHLAAWCRDKFGIEVSVDDMAIDLERGQYKSADEIIDLIEERARASYRRREIEYPVDHVLRTVLGPAQPTPEGGEPQQPALSAEGANYLRQWMLMKYGVAKTIEQLQTTPLNQLRDELTDYQQKWIDGGVGAWVEETTKAAGDDPAKLAEAFGSRFLQRIPADAFDPKVYVRRPSRPGIDLKDSEPETEPTPRDLLEKATKHLFRAELTQMEQFVLINIYDKAWKEHLYAMDMLKGGIGLQAFAEKDPRVAYKREGMKFFTEFQKTIRDQVTDLIFRVRIQGQQPAAKPAYKETAATHAASDPAAGGYGVGGDSAAPATATATAPAKTDPAKLKGDGRRQVKKDRNKKGKR